MTRPRTVAVIGTGLLGRAIAERLQAVGQAVIAYNRTESKALPLQAQGIAVVTRAEQAIAQADWVILVLADAAAVRSVLLAPAPQAALRGKTIVQMGTIGVDESLALRVEIAEAGGDYFEAPVLGSLAEAKTGTLLVMVGGTESQFHQGMTLFRRLGREPRYVGPVGKAAALKLALNQLIASETAAFAWSLGLVERSGVSVDSFMTVLRQSALFAPTFDKKLSRLIMRDYRSPNFSTSHLLKDLDLFLGQASALRLDVAGLECVKPLFKQTIDRGFGEADYSSIYEVINPADGSQDPKD